MTLPAPELFTNNDVTEEQFKYQLRQLILSLYSRIDIDTKFFNRNQINEKFYNKDEIDALITGANIEALEKILHDVIEVALAGGAGAAGWTDALIQTSSGRNQRERNNDFLSLHDFCKLNNSDETESFKAAIAAARSQNKKLTAYSGTIKISQDIDLRRVNIDLSGLTILIVGSAVVNVGWASGNVYAKTQILGSVYKETGFNLNPNTQTTPSVRVWGSKCYTLVSNQIDYVELYASTDPATYSETSSIGYCTFIADLWVLHKYATDPRYADGPQVDGPSSANQWINSNHFYITRMMGVEIDGSYPHNGNIYNAPTFENSSSFIKVNKGNKNQFNQIRGEGSPQVYFGATTEGNIVERAWYATTALFNVFSNFTDLGRQNKYTSSQLERATVIPVVRLTNKNDNIANTHFGNYANRLPTRKWIRGNAASRVIYQTAIFKVDARDILYFKCDSIDLNTSRYIARIYMYDENDNLITTGSADWLSGANFSSSFLSQGFFEGTFNSSGQTWFNLLNAGLDAVKGISIMILNASTFDQSRSKNIDIDLVTMRDKFSIITTNVSKYFAYDFVTAKPTQYIGKIGDLIRTNQSTSYRCTYSLTTTLSAAMLAGATQIQMSSTSVGGVGGIAVGDLVGIDLDNGLVHWSTIATISSGVVNLTDAISSDSSIGNGVYVSRII